MEALTSLSSSIVSAIVFASSFFFLSFFEESLAQGLSLDGRVLFVGGGGGGGGGNAPPPTTRLSTWGHV